MITLSEMGKPWTNGRTRFDFEGLSTDEKPVGEYEGLPIANGSTFMCLDTQEISFYDESKDAWL